MASRSTVPPFGCQDKIRELVERFLEGQITKEEAFDQIVLMVIPPPKDSDPIYACGCGFNHRRSERCGPV